MRRNNIQIFRFQVSITEPRPIYFVYSGMGSQWPGMAQKLMVVLIFNDSLIESSKCLEEYGVDVYKMLQSSDPKQYQVRLFLL